MDVGFEDDVVKDVGFTLLGLDVGGAPQVGFDNVGFDDVGFVDDGLVVGSDVGVLLFVEQGGSTVHEIGPQ